MIYHTLDYPLTPLNNIEAMAFNWLTLYIGRTSKGITIDT